MGEKKKRLEIFKEKHPKCCFCGGDTQTESIDHVPPRIFFEKKHRPDGMLFPACNSCNNRTSQNEQIAALIFRAGNDTFEGEEEKVLNRLLSGIRNNHPGLLESMNLSTREKRQFMRERGIRPVYDYTPSKFPIIGLDNPLIHESIKLVGSKLGAALHYQHTRKIIPQTGRLFITWRSNIQIHEKGLPEKFLNVLGPPNTLKQGTFEVSEQFSYRYACSENNQITCFIALFHSQAAIIGIVHSNPSNVDIFKDDDPDVYRPFPPPL